MRAETDEIVSLSSLTKRYLRIPSTTFKGGTTPLPLDRFIASVKIVSVSFLNGVVQKTIGVEFEVCEYTYTQYERSSKIEHAWALTVMGSIGPSI